MNGLVFEVQTQVVAPDPNRTDIACFVGFVGRRATPLVPDVRRWLKEQGWAAGPYARADFEDLLDIPVPVDTWEVFDRLFAWNRRPVDDGEIGPDAADPSRLGATYLGAAVRSFFAQGGRKCYVVRVGDPWPFATRRVDQPADVRRCLRMLNLSKLLPGHQLSGECGRILRGAGVVAPTSSGDAPSPADRESWRGIGHLFGLPDVSFICLPDLADIVGVEREPARREPPPTPPFEEQFVECSSGEEPPGADRLVRRMRAPRCDDEGYQDWARAVRAAATLVMRQRREVQFVAAVPVPEGGAAAESDLLEFLSARGRGPLANHPDLLPEGIASAFVQLVYPWARTPGSIDLPEQVESPDGVLTGVLARNALTRGTFRSAAGLHLADAYEIYPQLPRYQVVRQHADAAAGNSAAHALPERVSLIGPTARGLAVWSDVTTSLSESYRLASINRLVAVIIRASRLLGEETVFESSGEALWSRLRDRLNNLLSGLLSAGALRGQSAAESFLVRCDRSTMSQNDIDGGRVVVVVQFAPAAPVERITVVLAMEEGGQTSLLSADAEGRAARARAASPLAEAVGVAPLPPLVTLGADTETLRVVVDGVDQAIALPAGASARRRLAEEINRQVRGGYARFTGDEDEGEPGRLVIGSDRRGPGASVTVIANPALNFKKTTTAKGGAAL
jgi:hypothetical protein